MKSAKLSERTTPKLCASLPHRKTLASAAPASPINPNPAIGMRSPRCRKASATMAAQPDKTTMTIGMMAV